MKTSYYISHSKQYAPASINIGYYIHYSRSYHDPLSEQKVIMSAYNYQLACLVFKNVYALLAWPPFIMSAIHGLWFVSRNKKKQKQKIPHINKLACLPIKDVCFFITTRSYVWYSRTYMFCLHNRHLLCLPFSNIWSAIITISIYAYQSREYDSPK